MVCTAFLLFLVMSTGLEQGSRGAGKQRSREAEEQGSRGAEEN
jgi:hypothetical protein